MVRASDSMRSAWLCAFPITNFWAMLNAQTEEKGHGTLVKAVAAEGETLSHLREQLKAAQEERHVAATIGKQLLDELGVLKKENSKLAKDGKLHQAGTIG